MPDGTCCRCAHAASAAVAPPSRAALADAEHSDAALRLALPSLPGLISSCFDPFMVSYVLTERRYAMALCARPVPVTHRGLRGCARARSKMLDMLDNVMAEEKVDSHANLPVLTSSTNLFLYIKNAIARCTALTNGQAFFDLHKVLTRRSAR